MVRKRRADPLAHRTLVSDVKGQHHHAHEPPSSPADYFYGSPMRSRSRTPRNQTPRNQTRVVARINHQGSENGEQVACRARDAYQAPPRKAAAPASFETPEPLRRMHYQRETRCGNAAVMIRDAARNSGRRRSSTLAQPVGYGDYSKVGEYQEPASSSANTRTRTHTRNDEKRRKDGHGEAKNVERRGSHGERKSSQSRRFVSSSERNRNKEKHAVVEIKEEMYNEYGEYEHRGAALFREREETRRGGGVGGGDRGSRRRDSSGHEHRHGRGAPPAAFPEDEEMRRREARSSGSRRRETRVAERELESRREAHHRMRR